MPTGRNKPYQVGESSPSVGGKKSQILFPIITRKRLRTISSNVGIDSMPTLTTSQSQGPTSSPKVCPDYTIGLNFSELVDKDSEGESTKGGGGKRKRANKLFSFSVIQLKA